MKGIILKTTKIYWNLHKSCWSLKQGINHVVHTNTAFIKNAKFHVNEKLRQKVLKEKRRNVHAWISGELIENFDLFKVIKSGYVQSIPIEIHYNPYRCGAFTIKNNWRNDGIEEFYGIREYPLVCCQFNGKVLAIDGLYTT